jgi:hypothetical protein
VVPKRIEAAVGHFKNAADVRRLAFIEEEIRAVRVVIPAIAAFEKFQSDERIEEVPRGPVMEPESSLQCFEIRWVFRQLREYAHLDSTQQRFRSPEY